METQIAIETSTIIKASTENDSMQNLVTLFIAPSVATAREREDALWVFRINSLVSRVIPDSGYGRFTITSLVLVLVIRSLIFTGIVSRHYEYWM